MQWHTPQHEGSAESSLGSDSDDDDAPDISVRTTAIYLRKRKLDAHDDASDDDADAGEEEAAHIATAAAAASSGGTTATTTRDRSREATTRARARVPHG